MNMQDLSQLAQIFKSRLDLYGPMKFGEGGGGGGAAASGVPRAAPTLELRLRAIIPPASQVYRLVGFFNPPYKV